MTEVKICGIKTEAEIELLNEVRADYAGFVLFEKSKRYVTPERAWELMQKLNPGIRKVAVTVSPDRKLTEQIEELGFDFLQVHGAFDGDERGSGRLPLWRAVNLSGAEAFGRAIKEIPLESGYDAVLFDAGEYGSGKTFGWELFSKEDKECYQSFRRTLIEKNIKFVLAGGLTPDNVASGMKSLWPDVVDVSSGVEGVCGKDRELVKAFMRKTKQL